MKTLIYSLVILCSVILTTVFAAVYTDKMLTDFIESVDSKVNEENCEMAYIGAKEIEKEYKKLKKHFILFIRENDSCEAEAYIEDIKSSAKSDDPAGIATAKNRLMLHMEQLRRLSVFSMEAIF